MRAKTLQIIWHSKDPVFSIDFHPDGYFATGGADKEIKLWELSCAADGTPGVRHAASLEGHSATVNCVRFSKTGHFMASAGDSGEVIIWKPTPAAGAAATAADGSGSPRGTTSPLTPGSAAIAAACDGVLATTPAREAAAEAVDGSREENAVCGVKWKVAHTLRGHHDDVTDIAWAHDDAVLLTGSVENEVMLFDVHSRQNLQRLLGHRHYVQGVAYDPLGAWLVSASADRSVRVHGLKPPPSGGKGSAAVKSSMQLAREFIHSATLLKRTVQAPATPPRDAAAPAAPAPAAAPDAATDAADASTPQQQQQEQQAVPAKPLQAFLFQDESLAVFFRRMAWSPDGSLLAIPAGLAKAAQGSNSSGSNSSSSGVQHTTYVYARGSWSSPLASLPCPCKASTAVKFCPLLFKLQQPGSSSSSSSGDSNSSGSPSSATASPSAAGLGAAPAAAAAGVNALGLPYRMVLAVATLDSVLLYDMQTLEPFLIVGPLHYAPITDITWSREGSCLAVSSHDGYCSIVTFHPGELGEPLTADQLPDALLASLQKVAAAAVATAAKAGAVAAAAAALPAPVQNAAVAVAGVNDCRATAVPASFVKTQTPPAPQQQPSAAKAALKRIQPQAVTGTAGGSSPAAPTAAAGGGSGSSSQIRRISPSPVAACPAAAAAPAAAGSAKAAAPRRLTPTAVAAAAAPAPAPSTSDVIDLTEDVAAAAVVAAGTPAPAAIPRANSSGGCKGAAAPRRVTPQPVLLVAAPLQPPQQQQQQGSSPLAAGQAAAAPAAPQGRTALAALAAAKAAAAKKAAAKRAAEAGSDAAADKRSKTFASLNNS